MASLFRWLILIWRVGDDVNLENMYVSRISTAIVHVVGRPDRRDLHTAGCVSRTSRCAVM
jgi:hypothetical protein